MSDDIIPDDIRQFLLEHINSIAEWEGLLLLRTHPQQNWSVEEVARSLYIPTSHAAEVLAHLNARGFLYAGENQHYRYQPSSSEMENMVTRAAVLYARHLVPITHIIHSKSRTRIQKFADAFKLRKE